MASPTTPMHGKLGALYALRPNGFSGLGLNDLTWGTAATNAATAYYRVVLFGVGTGAGGVDQFKWAKNGAALSAAVDITGAAQTLDEGQTITFAATTGHTANDVWMAGNLKTEPTTESGLTAQITAAANRILNPNRPPVWTDSGGMLAERVNFTNGTAVFSGNVTAVTVTGNLAFVPDAALRKIGYLIDWSLNLSLDMADCSRMGQSWKESLPGMAGGSGSANAYFIASDTLLACLQAALAAGDKYFLLELFNYDPDQDQTGDHILAWVSFTSFALSADIGSVVKEAVNFTVQGEISFTANV